MLRVLTYNVCCQGVSSKAPWGFDPQRKHQEVVALIGQHEPDLVSLQVCSGAGPGTLLLVPLLGAGGGSAPEHAPVQSRRAVACESSAMQCSAFNTSHHLRSKIHRRW